MARREVPIDPADGPVAVFALQLRTLRIAAGRLTYREMAKKVPYTATALSKAARGQRLPSWDCVRAYLQACGVTEAGEHERWRTRWEAVQEKVTAAGDTGEPAAPVLTRDRSDHSADHVADGPKPSPRTVAVPAAVTQVGPPHDMPVRRWKPAENALRAPGPVHVAADAVHETFVGRRDELAALRHRLAQAELGRPATVMVGGEAGVGKSRLLREFTAMSRASIGHVLWGSCISLGSGEVPYSGLIDALRRLVREHGDDALREVGAHAYAELSGLVADFSDGPGTAPTSQLRVFGAVLRLLDRLGMERPVIMVIEDLHLADASTVDFIEYLARGQTTERVLLVCTYRSTDLRPGDRVRGLLAELGQARRIHRIDLSRFTPSELTVFLTVLTGEPPSSETIERCVELSDGNPFFVEELVAAGALVGHGVALPSSLREVLQARVNAVGEEEQEVLRVAAVAGRRVSHRLLAAVSALPDRQLTTALRTCVDQQMLLIEPTDDTYVFRHALLREAVYQVLLPGERLGLHAAIARALAAGTGLSYAEDMTVAAELAYHWSQAREFGPALEQSVRAGYEAVRMRAFRDAERQFERALDLWARVPDAAAVAGTGRVPLLAAAADAARWAGHVSRAVEHMRAALVETEANDKAELYERLGSYLWEAGDSAGSRQAYQRAVDLHAGGPPTVVLARVLAGQASAHLGEGRHSVGLAVAEEAVSVARAVGEAEAEGRALTTVGVALTLLGRTGPGIAAMRDAVRITGTVDNLEDLLRAYANLAFVLEISGRLDESLHTAETGYGIAHRFGLSTSRMGGMLANNISATLVLLGRWDEAAERLAQLLADRPVVETRYATLTLAEIHLARGRFEQAKKLLLSVGEMAGSAVQPRLAAAMAACLAEIELWRGDPAAARDAVAEGLASIREAENAELVLRLCALGLRAEADEHERLRAVPRQRSTVTDPVRRRAAELIEVVRKVGTDPRLLPEADAIRRQCVAEYARLDPTDPAETARRWQEAAEGWDAFGRPYPAAYARWRQAEAALAARDANGATESARAAYDSAIRLLAVPLRTEIESLARRGRIELAEPVAEPAGNADTSAAKYGLTRRELEVLRRLCDGHSNRQIAGELFITEKTVSAHVSNILTKLDVNSRGEAAAAAHRLQLVT